MDVPKQRTIDMGLVAHLHLRKHHQFLLSRYHLPQLHKRVACRLTDHHMSPGICNMLLILMHKMHPDQPPARSLLYRPMCQLLPRRMWLRRDHKSTSHHLWLPRRLEHWVLTMNPTQLLINGYMAPDHGTVLLVTKLVPRMVGSTLPLCKAVHYQQSRRHQM